jgi:hypothetical protein
MGSRCFFVRSFLSLSVHLFVCSFVRLFVFHTDEKRNWPPVSRMFGNTHVVNLLTEHSLRNRGVKKGSLCIWFRVGRGQTGSLAETARRLNWKRRSGWETQRKKRGF